MMFNKFEGTQELNLETMEYDDGSYIDCYGGGKGSSSQKPATQVLAPAVEPATLEDLADEDENNKKKKLKSRRANLVETKTGDTTGTNTATSQSGLKV